MDFSEGVLLDTCALIWFAAGTGLNQRARTAIVMAGKGAGVLVSAVSGWEIGLIARKSVGNATPPFWPDPLTWFRRAITHTGFRCVPLAYTAALAASRLPGDLHPDPADRLLIATARDLGMPIVTRDRKLLAYAAAGHVAALPC